MVWGGAYIDRFAALALPSLLAPGNLPALAQGSTLELLILTSAEGARYFRKHAALEKLKSICPVRFIEIDDLIAPGMYGVTLTLAYTRGVADSGEAMVNTHFVFLNSDFILADGSLESLLARIREGHGCILAPSFRVIAEEVEPLLKCAVDARSDILAMKARDMVRIAIDHVHPTTVAQIVDQQLLHSRHPNQLYWYLDENTMLGRFFLIFMLCIRPERVVTAMNSYCDYGFVPEMCPSGKIMVISDSDQVFILETQARLQEGQYLRLGGHSMEELAQKLAEWTTREHRRSATHDLLFHAQDLPATSAQASAQAGRYVDALLARLPAPKDHARHDYWTSGLQAWRQQRRDAGLTASAPESADRSDGNGAPALPSSLARLARALLIGARPFLRPWHFDWADYRMTVGEIRAAIGGENRRILVAIDRQNPLLALFKPDDPRIERTTLSRLANEKSAAPPGHEIDTAICILTPQDLAAAASGPVENLLRRLRSGAQVLLVLHNMGSDASRGDLTNDLIALMSQLPIARMTSVSARFCGGVLKRGIERAARSLLDRYPRAKLSTSLVGLPILALLAPVSLLNNFYLACLREPTRHVDYCSSFTLRFRKR